MADIKIDGLTPAVTGKLTDLFEIFDPTAPAGQRSKSLSSAQILALNKTSLALMFHTTNVAAASSPLLGCNGSAGLCPSFFMPNDGKLTRMYYGIDNTDTSYSAWTSGTIRWIILVNNVQQHSSALYTKVSFDAAAIGTNTKSISEDISIDVNEEDEINVVVEASASWNSPGAEVCAQVWGQTDALP